MGNFLKHLGSAAKNVGKKILNNPGRALEIAANNGTAAASKNPKLIAATAPDIIKFIHQGKGLYKPEGLSAKACTWEKLIDLQIRWLCCKLNNKESLIPGINIYIFFVVK